MNRLELSKIRILAEGQTELGLRLLRGWGWAVLEPQESHEGAA